MAPVVTMRQLLESGVHFGHQTRRWNPKMKRFILAERNGIYIIDLQQSLDYIDKAYEFIRETVAHGGTVLYVGTKKQAQEAIADQARRVGMPFVNQRWLGGMLTNFQTVHKRLQRLKELEEIDFEDVPGSGMTKKELLHLRRERDKLDRSLGGIKDMARVPSALWVVDTKKEHIAVSEARKLGIPVIAVLDTNCDPDEVDYPIPGNDDAIRSVSLLTRVVADAVADGLMARGGDADSDEKPAPVGALGTEEPLAEWERELLERKGSEDGARVPEPRNGAGPAEATPVAPAEAAQVAPAEAAPVAPAEAAQVAPAEAAQVAPSAAAPAEATTADAATATSTAEAATADAAPAEAATADAAPAEAATADAAPADAAPADAAPADAAPADAAPADAATAEAATADAATAEATTTDAATADAATADAATAEAATADAVADAATADATGQAADAQPGATDQAADAQPDATAQDGAAQDVTAQDGAAQDAAAQDGAAAEASSADGGTDADVAGAQASAGDPVAAD
jgi:ribosomal protein S2